MSEKGLTSWNYGALTTGAVQREQEANVKNSAPNADIPQHFAEMLRTVLADREMTLSSTADALGISVQYLHDLKEGRRLPSVEVIEKICTWLGRGPKGRLEWHQAGARAHGWQI